MTKNKACEINWSLNYFILLNTNPPFNNSAEKQGSLTFGEGNEPQWRSLGSHHFGDNYYYIWHIMYLKSGNDCSSCCLKTVNRNGKGKDPH